MSAVGGPRRGRLVAIEGIDGTGKSTLAGALADALRRRGEDVVVSFEPTKGKYGRQVRELAVTGREGVTPEREAELFTLDRFEHVRDVIEPALAAGKTVILDRYFYSTMAYQGARGLDPIKIEEANAFAPKPDLLVLLDLTVAEALERIMKKRGSIPDHFEGKEYLTQVSKQFENLERRARDREKRFLNKVREEYLEFLHLEDDHLEDDHPGRLRLDARRPTDALVAEVLGIWDRLDH
jgi:dTMP kinase